MNETVINETKSNIAVKQPQYFPSSFFTQLLIFTGSKSVSLIGYCNKHTVKEKYINLEKNTLSLILTAGLMPTTSFRYRSVLQISEDFLEKV